MPNTSRPTPYEQQIRLGVIAPMLTAEPGLARDVVFGIRSSGLLADRFSALLLGSWEQGRSALRVPLSDAPVLVASASSPVS